MSSMSSYILIGVLVVILIGAMVLMNRRNKKREKDAQDLINAVKPGNKVKTIGGIVGIVVEVNDAEDTFVLETGSEASGKSHIKFIRQAIYESDAVVEHADSKPAKAKKGEAAVEETPVVEEPFTETADAPVEVTPVEETESKKNKK